ncbi:hypothetical protein Hanom_Chr11g01048811 [Helianthus anomalus]
MLNELELELELDLGLGSVAPLFATTNYCLGRSYYITKLLMINVLMNKLPSKYPISLYILSSTINLFFYQDNKFLGNGKLAFLAGFPNRENRLLACNLLFMTGTFFATDRHIICTASPFSDGYWYSKKCSTSFNFSHFRVHSSLPILRIKFIRNFSFKASDVRTKIQNSE